jgi:hypothetical protein
MSDELKKKVGRLFCDTAAGQCGDDFFCEQCLGGADEAIVLIRAEVLEEAAKVADDLSDRWTKEWRAGLKADSRLEALSDGADDVAFAIRALKEERT